MTREFSDGQVVPGTRYSVLGHLGSGGMGSVYLVEHTELGKQFVLKALFRELAGRKDLVGRLRQEWRALARLNHPNIVNVTDAGTSDNGVPFYVMERVEGETLSDLLRREHALGIPRAVSLCAAVLEGLSAAHEIGIVHRDVKPPNIFVVAGGSVKLLDFGIAKLADQSAEVITARGIAIGTPRYMSPEQAKGQAVDARADLYAVGLVLFETIAGTGPFDDARDANELLLCHLSKPPPRLSAFHRGVTPELDDIVASLLAKDPNARPANAKAVAASLRALLRRAAPVPSTGSATPDARYDAPTFGQMTALPSTRPDGVAGRPQPTVRAPLVANLTSATTTTILEAPGGTTLSAAADTKAGMEWAKDGFETFAAPGSVSAQLVDDTLLASGPPSAAQSAPFRRGDHTLRLEEGPSPPPNEVPTRTSVPMAELSPPLPVTRSMPDVPPLPAHYGETPPPFLAVTPAPSQRAPTPSRAPIFLGLAALAILVGGVGAFFGLRASSRPRPAAAAVEAPLPVTVVAAPAPTEAPAPEASAEPPPDPSAAPTPRAPTVTEAPKSRGEAARPGEKPREKPVGERPKATTKLPASGL